MDQAMRRELVAALRGGQAYDTFEQILAEIPAEKRFVAPPGGERSAWQIVAHMRVALEDLVEYSDNSDGSYRERDWPDEYWPARAVPNEEEWNSAVQGFLTARGRMEKLVAERDLTKPFPWSTEGHTLLREALIAIEHNAHHLGQLVELARWLRS